MNESSLCSKRTVCTVNGRLDESYKHGKQLSIRGKRERKERVPIPAEAEASCDLELIRVISRICQLAKVA